MATQTREFAQARHRRTALIGEAARDTVSRIDLRQRLAIARLPLARAARASPATRQHHQTLPGAREHAFGEDRRRAGPPRAEHLRVGASYGEQARQRHAVRPG